MNDTAILLSSMSPKIRHKLKPGETQFRRVSGASILALRRNIRRSIKLEKLVVTEENENLNIVESSSTASSFESESCPSLQLKATQEGSIIVIPDSDCSLDEGAEPNDCLLLLPKEKIASISNWVANVNTENTISSVYTDISTICGTESGNMFSNKENGHAVNSTFIDGDNKKFDELFSDKHKKLVDPSISDSDQKNVTVIEDSFQNSKTNCVGTPNSGKWQSIQLSEDSPSLDKENIYLKNRTVEFSPLHSPGGFQTPTNTSNKWREIEISDDSLGSDTNAEDLLDELYGNSWRVNKELILSQTEPRKKNKPRINQGAQTERKPKLSLLYKNPYLDSEVSKSQNLMKSLQLSRLQKTPRSPLMESLRYLRDSDSESEKSPENPHKKLDFNSSGGDDNTKSKYFKKNKDSLYVNTKIRNRTRSSSSDDLNKFENFDFNLDNLSESSKNESDNSSDSFGKNLISANKNTNKFKILSESSDDEAKMQTNTKNKTYRTKDKELKSTKNKTAIKKNTINSVNSYFAKNIINKTGKSGLDNSFESDTNKINKKVQTNTKTKSVIKKKPVKNNIDKEAPAPSSVISSDEEWEEQVSKIDRRLTISDDGLFSFLSSLSANVPVMRCNQSARIYKIKYKTHKNELLKKLFNIYNSEVFDNILPQDMLIEWGDKMTKTAGFCYCRKVTKKSGEVLRSARIVLSTKVLDTADRLRDTLIHELCHAATWIANCVSDGHGDYWKAWAFKAMQKFPELPAIKRCHNYVINTKYTYRCTSCGYSIGRHSKSLDIERKRCGYCMGKFEVLINKVNKNGETKAVAAAPKKQATGFAIFVKENYGIYKCSERKHGDVMKVLGKKFKELQVEKK